MKMKIIAFDGPDGCGKTTMAELIHDWLSIDQKLQVDKRRMPGATALGQVLRDVVKSKAYLPGPMTERLIFAADTAQFFHELHQKPYPNDPDIMICDRWSPITDLIYGQANGVQLARLDELQQVWGVYREYLADLYIVFQVPVETVLERKHARSMGPVASGFGPPSEKDCRIEALGDKFTTEICDAYNSIYNIDGGTETPNPTPITAFMKLISMRARKIRVVNANQSIQQVKEDVKAIIRAEFPGVDQP